MGRLAVFREQDKRRAGYPYAGKRFFWKTGEIPSSQPQMGPPCR